MNKSVTLLLTHLYNLVNKYLPAQATITSIFMLHREKLTCKYQYNEEKSETIRMVPSEMLLKVQSTVKEDVKYNSKNLVSVLP